MTLECRVEVNKPDRVQDVGEDDVLQDSDSSSDEDIPENVH